MGMLDGFDPSSSAQAGYLSQIAGMANSIPGVMQSMYNNAPSNTMQKMYNGAPNGALQDMFNAAPASHAMQDMFNAAPGNFLQNTFNSAPSSGHVLQDTFNSAPGDGHLLSDIAAGAPSYPHPDPAFIKQQLAMVNGILAKGNVHGYQQEMEGLTNTLMQMYGLNKAQVAALYNTASGGHFDAARSIAGPPTPFANQVFNAANHATQSAGAIAQPPAPSSSSPMAGFHYGM